MAWQPWRALMLSIWVAAMRAAEPWARLAGRAHHFLLVLLGSICLGGVASAAWLPSISNRLPARLAQPARRSPEASPRDALVRRLLGDREGRVSVGGIHVGADGVVLDEVRVRGASLLFSARRVSLEAPPWQLLFQTEGARPPITITGARLLLVEEGGWNLARFVESLGSLGPLGITRTELRFRDATVELHPRRGAATKLTAIDADVRLRRDALSVRLHRSRGLLAGSGTIEGRPDALALRLQLSDGTNRAQVAGTLDAVHRRAHLETDLHSIAGEIKAGRSFTSTSRPTSGQTSQSAPSISSGRATFDGDWVGGSLRGRLTLRDVQGGGGLPFHDGHGDGVLDGKHLTLMRFEARIPGGALSGSGRATLDGALSLDFQVRPDGRGRLPEVPGWTQLLLRAGQRLSSTALIDGHVEKRPRRPARLSYHTKLPRPPVVAPVVGMVRRTLTHTVPRFVGGLF